jgi:hypothetical protein
MRQESKLFSQNRETGEAAMSDLMIQCPSTGKEISTGIDTDTFSLKLTEDVISSTFCPHCGQAHEWKTHETWLADSGTSNLRFFDL